MENKVITLRNVYGKVKEVHIQPGRMANGSRYPFVKQVRYDAMGNPEMIMSDEERSKEESMYYLSEDEDIVINDGTTFDLSDPLQYNKWMCIKDTDIIAPTRDARDRNGNLYIDGDTKRYGNAEFYVEIPGDESARSVSKKQKITKAWTFIGQDSKNGRLTKCKILGKYMENSADSEVEDYLYQRAEKNPDEILELYTSGDMALKLLLVDAKSKGVIIKKDGMYCFEDTILGANDDAIMIYFKDPTHKRVLDQIKIVTYPEYAPVSAIETKIAEVENIEIPELPKKTIKKK